MFRIIISGNSAGGHLSYGCNAPIANGFFQDIINYSVEEGIISFIVGWCL